MKLTTFLLLLSVISVFASKTYSQTKALTLNMENSTVKEVLHNIQKQSEFVFMYSEKLIDVNREVTIDIKDQKINEVLDKLFAETDVSYKVKGRFILLTTPEVTGNDLIESQQNTVSGTVTDESGQPLPGVTVVVKGTTQGMVTNADGNYSLANIPGDATLVFSFVGMKTQEIPVSGKNSINVTLVEETIGLEEVVAIGYGTMKKSDLTGSVVSANIEAFRESPNVNIMQSLQGSVPGLNIGQINSAGEEPSISIRGRNSLSGNTSVLIVVDEAIYSGSIGDLNPADIKSIEVLKDASSKAIYGSQAANGVILITTKGGKATKKPIFNYSASVSSLTPTVNARLLNREETLEKVKGICYEDAYLAPDYTQPNPEFVWSNTELFTEYQEGIENGMDFDWYDALTSPGFIMDHTLSISGGTEKTTYYLSGGYTDNEGFLLNDNYQRSTVRINFENEITKWLTVGMKTFGSFTDFSGKGVSVSMLRVTSPLASPYDKNGNLLPFYTSSRANVNPFLEAESDDMDLRDRISGIFYGIIKIPKIDGLTYRINYNNSSSKVDAANANKYGANFTGSVWKEYSSINEVMLDNILSYKKQLNGHGINATLVYGYRKAAGHSTRAEGSDVPNIALSYNSLEQALIQHISSSGWEETSLYQMGRMNYNYKDRYLLTTTLRRDGFSGFAKNNKFAWFPSVGVGWVLSNEPYFKIPIINYLKLRASFGQNGNQTYRYSSLSKISATEDNKYVFGDGASTSRGQSVTSLANNNLSWEKTMGLNVGFDFGILNNRINGNMEYYQTTTTDLLWNMVLPDMSGFSTVKTNLGEIANSGFEFSIQAKPVQTSAFSWDFDVNFSTNTNKIVSLLGDDNNGDGKEDDLIASGLFIGKSIQAIYSYEIDGIWQLEDDIPTGFNPGNYRIVDQDGDGKITADDRVFLGKQEPAFRMGIQNNIRYKDFTLRFFINSIQGGKNSYLGKQFGGGIMSSTGNFTNSNSFTFFDFWSVTNPDAKYSITYNAPQTDAPKLCSRSFIRLQDISLSYQLNRSIIQKFGIEGVKLYISGKNLLTFTNWDGWDPEAGLGISVDNAYPVMKSFSLGFNITF